MGKRIYKPEDLEFRREKLKELWDTLRLTQVDLAKITMINKDTISRCGTGRMKLSDRNMAKIIKNLTSENLAERIKKLDLDINTVQLIETIKNIGLDEKYFVKPAYIKKQQPAQPVQQEECCGEEIEANLICLSIDAHKKIHKYYTRKSHQESYEHKLGKSKPEK